MAEGLKPLKVSQRPSDSSHAKIGTTAIPDHTETWSLMPKIVAIAGEEQRGSDESQRRNDTWHESRPVHHVAQQQGIQAGNEAGSEQKRLITDRNERLAHSDQRVSTWRRHPPPEANAGRLRSIASHAQGGASLTACRSTWTATISPD